MNTLKEILERYPDEEFLKADGFDEAVIGVEYGSLRLTYSIPKCMQILIEEDDMSEIDAIEHFEYNVAGSYVGEKTPIWIYDDF